MGYARNEQMSYFIAEIISNLMIIGEGPSTEDEQGIPFVGRAGQLLTKILESVEINRDDIYITNTVKCRPPKNGPLQSEMDECQDYLVRQLEYSTKNYLFIRISCCQSRIGSNSH